MLSNSAVKTQAGMRWVIHASITAAMFAVLYKYWLTTPALQYVSIGRWRLFAIAAAAVCGGVLSLLRVSTPALLCGVVAGLLLGGTWVVWTSPHDLPISVDYAFTSHLQSFWREILGMTLAATLAGFCCACFTNRRARLNPL